MSGSIESCGSATRTCWAASRVGIAVLLLQAPLLARPRTVYADREVRRAWLAAEVKIVSIGAGNLPPGGKRPRWRITVRVTDRPERIYRGFARLGEIVELTTPAAGPRSCTTDCMAWMRQRRRILIVATRAGVIRIGGVPSGGGSYRLRGWYDVNACWIRCDDPTWGKHYGFTKLDVTYAQLRHLHRAERQAFWARVARFVSGEAPSLHGDELQRLVGELRSRDRGRREQAHQAIVERGPLAIRELAVAARGLTDPEARRRMQAVLQALADYRVAFEVSRRIPGDARLFVLREGVHKLTGLPLEQALRSIDRLKRG